MFTVLILENVKSLAGKDFPQAATHLEINPELILGILYP